MTRTIQRAAVALALVAVTASAAAAQAGPGRRMMAGQHAMQGGPLRMMPALAAFQPRALLAREAELGLTAAQVDSLEAIAATEERLVAEAQQTHQDAQQNLRREAALAAPDESQVAEAFWAAHAAMGKQHWAEVHASIAAKALLTPDQRTQAETTP